MKYCALSLVAAIALLLGACGEEKRQSGSAAGAKGEVVVYTPVDDIYALPILEEFAKKTGIKVKPRFDAESAKLVGLVNALLAESDNPRCDVFWNSEISRTVFLKQRDILEKYESPSAADIPPEFKDKDGYWAGYAARGRVIVYNIDKMRREEVPGSFSGFAEARWKGKCSLARPLFGTTSTHALALFQYLGPDRAKELFRAVRANDVHVAAGNATVRDQVARAECLFGWTDTDDVWVGLENNKPIGMVYPDQGEGQMGMVLIPNTVALIKGAPNAENGKKLIDYLLSREVEQKLADGRSHQIPVRKDLRMPKDMPPLESLKILKVDYEAAVERLDEVNRFLDEVFRD